MIDNKIEIRGIVYHLGPDQWMITGGRRLFGWEKFFKGSYDWDDIDFFEFSDLYGHKQLILVDGSWEKGEAAYVISIIKAKQSKVHDEIIRLGTIEWKKLNGYE